MISGKLFYRQHPVSKFLGKCNDIKRALNVCLKEEVRFYFHYWNQYCSTIIAVSYKLPYTPFLTSLTYAVFSAYDVELMLSNFIQKCTKA